MKNIKAAREAAKSTKPVTTRAALVSTGTANKIADLADKYSLSPAVIAGTIAEIGCDFLTDDALAAAAKVDPASCYRQLITLFDFPTAQTSVPILITENLAEESYRFEKGMNRSREELLGQFIEMAICRYNKPDVLYHSLSDLGAAVFHYKAVVLREEHEGDSEALALMKPPAKAPPAFIAFEKLIAAKGGLVA